MSIIIGIDPGLSGAVASLRYAALGNQAVGDHHEIEVTDTPQFLRAGTKGRHDYDVQGMVKRLAREREFTAHIHIFIERQQAMPGQGVSSMFKLGYGYGIWLGIIATLELPFTVISPRSWTGVMLEGVPGEGKERSLVAAQRLFPAIQIGKSYRGRADALLIAEYGRRRLASE